MGFLKNIVFFLFALLLLGALAPLAQPLCPAGVWENRPGDQGAGVVDIATSENSSGGSFVFVATDGGGVFLTTDRGLNYTEIGPCCSHNPCMSGRRIYSIVASRDMQTATDWAVYVGTDNGVWRYDTSTDTWMHVLVTPVAVTALAVPTDFSYEAWLSGGPNQHIFAAARGLGIFFSGDAGDQGTWTELTQGDVAPVFLNVARMILAPDYIAGNPTFLFAGTRSMLGNDGRLLRFDPTGLSGQTGWMNLVPGLGSGVDLTGLTTSSMNPFDGYIFLGTSSRKGPITGSGALFFSDSANASNPDFTSMCGLADQRGILSLGLSPLADPLGGSFPVPGLDRLLIGTDTGMIITDNLGAAMGGPCNLVYDSLFNGRRVTKVSYPAGYLGDSEEIVYGGTNGGFMVATLADTGCKPKERSARLRDFGTTALLPSPDFANDGTVFAGSETGGLLKSKDGGNSFQPMNNFYFFDANWNPVIVPPVVTDLGISNAYSDGLVYGLPKHLWLATRQNGVYQSDTGGWCGREVNGYDPNLNIPSLNSPESRAGRTLEVSPNYINGPLGGDGTVIYGTAGAGIWRFQPALEEWCQTGNATDPNHKPCNQDCTFGSTVCTDLGSNQVNDLALSNLFFFDASGASVTDINRTIFAATDTGLYKTVDYGDSWAILADVPAANVLEVKLSPDYSGDGTVFCVVEGIGIFYSDDFGDTFSQRNTGLTNPTMINHLALHPGFSGTDLLLASDRAGRFFLSGDRGANWNQQPASGLPCNEGASALTFLPGSELLAGFRSLRSQFSPDLANSFMATSGYTNLPGDVRNIVASKNLDANTGERVLFGASPEWGIFASFDGGQRWRPFSCGLEDVDIIPFYGALGVGSTVQNSGQENIIVGTLNHGVVNLPVASNDFRSPWIYSQATSLQPSCDTGLDPFVTGSFPEITVFPGESIGSGDPIFASGPTDGLFQSTDGGLCYQQLLDPLVTSSTNLDFGDAAGGSFTGTASKTASGGRGLPEPYTKVSSVIWSSSLTSGVSFSDNSGVSFSSANGTGNTILPNTSTNAVIQHSSLVVVVATDDTSGTNIGGVYWSPDEGVTTWVESQTLGSTYNVVEMIEIVSNGDILAAEDDSVWLSGDRGNHWIDIGATLDPGADLSDIVSDSGTPPEYYVGSATAGSYGSTITAGTYPTVVSLDVGTGPATGDTTVTITGTGFEAGSVCTFGGVDSTTITVNSTVSITCDTPPHYAATVDVGVRNLDTREGLLADGFIYTGDNTITSVAVTKNGSNAVVAWTVSGATGIYQVTRSDRADFTDLGATIDVYDVYYDLDYEDPDSGSVYFYQVQ